MALRMRPVLIALAATLVPAIAQAQLVPPAPIELADVELEASLASEVGDAVELVVVVEPDGRATLDELVAPAGVAEAVAAALERSRFAAATRDGAAVRARVRVRLAVRALAPPLPPLVPPLVPPPSPFPLEPEQPRGVPTFSAIARTTPDPIDATTTDAREARDLPGLQGDPYRVVETLPGVVPLLSGLPYSYVRGAPPAGTLYLYDDIPIPTLFHVAAGPSTIQAARLGAISLYAGVAPARYGRYVGGVVTGEARPPSDVLGGEVELRLLDLNAYLNVPVGPAVIRASGRVGYPGPIVSALVPGLELEYYDYQLSADVVDDHGGRTRVIALGGYDRLRQTLEEVDALGEADPSIVLHFHRVELRHWRAIGRDAEVGAALRAGYDRSRLGEALEIELLSMTPRFWATFRAGPGYFRVGGDLVTSSGAILLGVDPDPSVVAAALGTGAYAGARTRTAIGGYVEAVLPVPGVLRLELGMRVDAWITQRDTQVAPSPRARLVVHVTDWLDVHGALGLAHQPAVLFLPLPGLADVPVDRGLQAAVQSDWGAAVRLPEGFELEAQGYLHLFDRMLLPDLYVQARDVCIETFCTQIEVDPRARARSAGLEIFLRRDLRQPIAGWISYTLGEASARSYEGFEFTPGFDVRHVISAVLRVRPIEGLEISARAFARSGRVVGRYFVDVADDYAISRFEQRLPWFYRLDAEISYAWDAGWARLRVSAGWINLTINAEPIGLECDAVAVVRPTRPCGVQYAPAVFLPSLGIRGEI